MWREARETIWEVSDLDSREEAGEGTSASLEKERSREAGQERRA